MSSQPLLPIVTNMTKSAETEKIPFQKDKSKLTDLVKNNYGTIKVRLLEAAEELKMRRENDKENEERVNKLITEKFELKRAKEEEISMLTKSMEELKQENLKLQKEYDEKMKMHEEDKAAQNISINSSSKGIKSLKDEILVLQLAKYSLEKKMKDQDHQLQLEVRGRDETSSKMVELEKEVAAVREQCHTMHSRLEYLSSLVVKTEQMHQKLVQVNEHHKCVISNYQNDVNKLQGELTTAKAELVIYKENEKKRDERNMDPLAKEEFCEISKLKNLQLLNEQIERELGTTRDQKKFVMSSLAESNRMLSTLQSKFDNLNELNGSYRIEIDELKNEKEDVVEKVKAKDKELENIMQRLRNNEEKMCKTENAFDNRMKSLETNTSTLQLTIEALEGENTDLKKQNEDLRNRISKMEVGFTNTENDGKDTGLRNQELENVAQSLQKQVESLQESKLIHCEHSTEQGTVQNRLEIQENSVEKTEDRHTASTGLKINALCCIENSIKSTQGAVSSQSTIESTYSQDQRETFIPDNRVNLNANFASEAQNILMSKENVLCNESSTNIMERNIHHHTLEISNEQSRMYEEAAATKRGDNSQLHVSDKSPAFKK